MTKLVKSILDEHDFDLVVASTEVMAVYALKAPQGTLRILEEHNSALRWSWERYQNQRSSLQRLRRWVSWQKLRRYEARLFPQFDLCTMVSQQDRETSTRMLPGYQGRIEVVPNGVDCEYNQPGVADTAPNTLVYNGALTYSANHDAMRHFLTRIYPLIRKQVPQVSLTITGSLEGVDLSGLHLDDSVKLSDYVQDIRPLVASSAACVVPLQEGGGTRIKILEAMALGTPVISTTKGAEGLAAEDGEHLLLADDPEAFAMRTVELLQNRALRQRLATNGRRLVEETYDWRQIGERFVALVEQTALQAKRNGL
jgi:glycosyltransferase involved in cell wall biosynthesis